MGPVAVTARADDRIYWAPTDTRISPHSVALWHPCKAAVVVDPVTREQLDYMALGTCRYCDEKLPVPA